MFKLHPRIKSDTLPLLQLPLCQVRLMNDMHYPWLVLIPQRPDIEEIYQLEPADQQQLIAESALIARVLREGMQSDKINIAAFGNKVSQLHIHHIARYQNDAAWPESVFGFSTAEPYTPDYLILMQQRLRHLIELHAEGMRLRWHLR